MDGEQPGLYFSTDEAKDLNLPMILLLTKFALPTNPHFS